MTGAALAVLLALAPGRAEESSGRSEISQDISIKGRAAGGPPIQVPPPAAEKPVIDQVIRSLNVYSAPYRVRPPEARLSAVSARLNRPFPSPPYLVFSPRAIAMSYDSWVFEVFRDEALVWKTEGTGPLKDRLEWDGSGLGEGLAIQVGRSFWYRFTGRSAGKPFTLTSDPIRLNSITLKEYLSEVHLEASNAILFDKDRPSLNPDAHTFLKAMGDRMRRVNPSDEDYRFILYADDPAGALAKGRADNLRRFFSKSLLVNPKKIDVELSAPRGRGDVTVCVLPSDRGSEPAP